MAEIATPKISSTIILVRPDVSGVFEVFMTRRPQEMKFLGGFYVFPGGTIRKGDYSPKMLARCYGRSHEDVQRLFGNKQSPELSLGHWVGGIRELYEEVGILLCVTETGEPLVIDQEETRGRLAEKRKTLVAGSTDFSFILESERLYCDVGSPIYFSHRVTPEKYPIRFDTRFFLARLPASQTPLASSQEVMETLWVTPKAALDLHEGGDLPIMPPTVASLTTLAGFESWDHLCAKYDLR